MNLGIIAPATNRELHRSDQISGFYEKEMKGLILIFCLILLVSCI